MSYHCFSYYLRPIFYIKLRACNLKNNRLIVAGCKGNFIFLTDEFVIFILKDVSFVLPFQPGREDAEYCGGGYDLHHDFPETVGGEVYSAVVGEFGLQFFVFEAPAGEDAAEHRGQRHHDAVG